MNTSDTVIHFCAPIAVGFVTDHLFDIVLGFLANNPFPHLIAALMCYYTLGFIFVALCVVPIVFVRCPGTLCWYHRFSSVEEADDFIKLCVFWWLVLFMCAVTMEVVVLGVYTFPFIIGTRYEHCDDPEYTSVLLVVMSAIDEMRRNGGIWRLFG
ncbi:hypothetical protein MKX08_003784 [Trichoderma sp. CBMAI-0020]|nr:hypothetical protein MKX08_003784 [Trichoderma sp. CBMAI-0020]